jgi:hypothetical protein
MSAHREEPPWTKGQSTGRGHLIWNRNGENVAETRGRDEQHGNDLTDFVLTACNSHADLLAACKAKLADCRENGACADAALLPGEYCSTECDAMATAVEKAEGPPSFETHDPLQSDPKEPEPLEHRLARIESLCSYIDDAPSEFPTADARWLIAELRKARENSERFSWIETHKAIVEHEDADGEWGMMEPWGVASRIYNLSETHYAASLAEAIDAARKRGSK